MLETFKSAKGVGKAQASDTLLRVGEDAERDA
jgi:hypothetical protein